MSGATVARALRERFEEIRRAELARLYKKTAGLTDAQRADIEGITAEVVHALAQGPARALEQDGGAALIQATVHLFRPGLLDRLSAH
jgi:glutamyl-tRNA reductase